MSESLNVTQFQLERILSEDTHLKSIVLFGTLPVTQSRAPALLLVQKTPFSADAAVNLASNLTQVQEIEKNDIYSWLHAWSGVKTSSQASKIPPDLKVTVICPATEAHIRKYSAQKQYLVRETPALYNAVTKPFITSIPPSRIQWVYNILNHVKEADQILFEDPSPSEGFVILPDLKWDRKTLNSLYLVAIAHSANLKSLRGLKKQHLPMLNKIRTEAYRVVKEKWGIEAGGLRLYIHYQPSYYQFHVHIVTLDYAGSSGMSVGQAHLLEEVISLLECDSEQGPGIFERMTLSFVLGEQHGLFAPMKAAGAFEAN